MTRGPIRRLACSTRRLGSARRLRRWGGRSGPGPRWRWRYSDIDRFKVINDTYGHLTGDQVLKEIARALDSFLRDYDRAGRFGGRNSPCCCRRPGRWMPSGSLSVCALTSPACPSSSPVRAVASGCTSRCRSVAALDAGSKREYSELMAAADAALYRAKAGGRDQVQMISTTRGLSAISGALRGNDGNDNGTKGGRPDAPSVFRRAQIS